MGLLDLFRGKSSQQDLKTAETYLSGKCSEDHISALVRHYAIEEVTEDIQRRTGARIKHDDTVKIVQGLRDQYGLGPIKPYNMPGFRED